MTPAVWVRASPDALLVVASDGCVGLANPAAVVVFGSDPTGRPVADLLGDDVACAIVTPDGPMRLEAEVLGGPVVEVSVTRLADAVLVRLRDLTADHALEAELTRLASFAEMSATPMFEVRTSGDVTWANPAARRWLAIPAAGAVVDQILELPGDRHARAEVRVGERWYALEVQPIHAWKCVRVLALDITAERATREALEQRVTERTAELARAESDAHAANHAKSRFLANMSHELRTPLNAIIGYAELLADADATPEARADLERICGAANHLLHLVDGVLDLSKIEAGRVELDLTLVPVTALVAEVEQTTRGLVERNGNAFDVQFDGAGFVVRSDRARLRQILINLIGNAAKFTRGGRVALRVRGGRDDVAFDVADTGIGIAPAQVERIFEPFVQGDTGPTRRYAGTGLGLAISREFARLLGGSITVRSTAGEGSTFTVRLPRT